MLTKEDLAALEATHKRIAHVIGPLGKDGKTAQWECVFRKPTRAEYKRFRSMVNTPGQGGDAGESLARSCVVHPAPEAFDALLEDYPAICEASAQDIGKLAGLFADESVK